MRIVALLFVACTGVSGCVSTPLGGRPYPDATTNLAYGMVRTYYDLTLHANGQTLQLDIAGPHTEADPEHIYSLDLRHSGFSADRFSVARDKRGRLSLLTLSSRSRAPAIAAALGSSLGAAAAMQSPRSDSSRLEDAPTTPADYTLYQRRWRIENDSVTDVQNELNLYIQEWRRRACGQGSSCTPAPSLTLTAPSIQSLSPPLGEIDCRRVLCVSGPARAQLGVNVVFADSTASSLTSDLTLPMNRSLRYEDEIVSPTAMEYFDPAQHALAGGFAQLFFVDGALTYAAYARESEVEAAVGLPFEFVASALNSIFRVLPVRIAIDIQRTQSELVHEGELTAAPGNTGGVQAIASGTASASDRAASGEISKPNERETVTHDTSTRTLILGRREAPSGGGGRGNALPEE